MSSRPRVRVYQPPIDESAMEEERRKQRELARKAKGRKATILTGGRGVLEEPPLAYKTLLGE